MLIELEAIHETLISRRSVLDFKRSLLAEKQSALSVLEEQIALLRQAVDFIGKLSEDAQLAVLTFMEQLLSSGVQDVFDPVWSVKLELTKRGGRPAIALYLDQGDGIVVEVPDGVGGGVQQVLGVLMRFAVLYLLRGQRRTIMFLDEPFAHLSAAHIEAMIDVLKGLVATYNFEVLIVTHQQRLIDVADIVYSFSNVDNKTLVERLR